MRSEIIDLGRRLNQLLDHRTQLGQKQGGLVLPSVLVNQSCDTRSTDEDETGNVVIEGEPGSGKSTLGLQIAVAAARCGFDSAFISLEEEEARILHKARIFGWQGFFYSPQHPFTYSRAQSAPSLQGQADPSGLATLLNRARKEAQAKLQITDEQGIILLPGLLPRPLTKDSDPPKDFYWNQYRLIEFLIRSSAEQNRSYASPGKRSGIRLVVIDSLNMLGIERSNREMMHRLFDLFRHNQILGVFTNESKGDTAFDSTMGDVVFKFSKTTDSGYEITLLECSKSRFSARSLGLHPYKIKVPVKAGRARVPVGNNLLQAGVNGEVGVVVYPSPHAVIQATEKSKTPGLKGDFKFGWGAKMTGRLLRVGLHRGNVVTLAGPDGTFKTQIALNFLLHGIASKESVLYLRLRSPEDLILKNRLMPYGTPVLTQDSSPEPKEEGLRKAINHLVRSKGGLTKLGIPWQDLHHIGERTKAQIVKYAEGGQPTFPQLIVADFRTGMLMPEEFIDIVIRIILEHGFKNKRIRRVVLDDVGTIGTSYPLLRHSTTAGDMFLSSFVHILRNYGVDLLLVGTSGDLSESNVMVNQACSLADAVLRTSIGTVFGDKYVLLSGDGLAGKESNLGDSAPVVLRPDKKDGHKLIADAALLNDFVGFESGQIERPGIVLQLYQEGTTQRAYNLDVLRRLQERYGKPDGHRIPGVRLISFHPQRLASVPQKQESPSPKEHTVVRMIDEFERSSYPDQRDNKMFIRNVLVMAYRTDWLGSSDFSLMTNWQAIANKINSCCNEEAFGTMLCIDHSAPETLACLVLGCLLRGGAFNPKSKKQRSTNLFLEESRKKGICRELSALRALILSPLGKHHGNFKRRTQTLTEFRNVKLAPDSAVYVCWYSQLRDLLNNYPELATQLNVCSLPGGGFRGDWYLRVDPGSVSVSLGKSIVEELVSQGEDFERFQVGLSLPVNKSIWESDLLAWPGASATVTMTQMHKIWIGAKRRSSIKKYVYFNRLLSGIGETVFRMHPPTSNGAGDEFSEHVSGIISRLQNLVTSLHPK